MNIIKLLIDKEANANRYIQNAVDNNNTELTESLINGVTDKNILTNCLQKAVSDNNTEIIKLLTSKGANANDYIKRG